MGVVMDDKGNLFNERRKKDRRSTSKDVKQDTRKSNDRRKKDINKK